jgi:TonB family protein
LDVRARYRAGNARGNHHQIDPSSRARRGGQWPIAVRIRGAHTGAYVDALTPPRYPPEGFKRGVEANIVSTIEVSADGKVSIQDMEFTGSRDQIARDDFLEAAKAAILTWRVQPERVGGHAVATRMQIPMSFCIDTGGKWCAKHAFREAKGGPVPPETPIALESAVRLLNLPAGREI